MHDLGHGRPVELGLPAEGLEAALCDITGDALHKARHEFIYIYAE